MPIQITIGFSDEETVSEGLRQSFQVAFDVKYPDLQCTIKSDRILEEPLDIENALGRSVLAAREAFSQDAELECSVFIAPNTFYVWGSNNELMDIPALTIAMSTRERVIDLRIETATSVLNVPPGFLATIERDLTEARKRYMVSAAEPNRPLVSDILEGIHYGCSLATEIISLQTSSTHRN